MNLFWSMRSMLVNRHDKVLHQVGIFQNFYAKLLKEALNFVSYRLTVVLARLHHEGMIIVNIMFPLALATSITNLRFLSPPKDARVPCH